MAMARICSTWLPLLPLTRYWPCPFSPVLKKSFIWRTVYFINFPTPQTWSRSSYSLFSWTYSAIPAVPAVQWACKASAWAWSDGGEARASLLHSSDSDNMPTRKFSEDFASLWIIWSVSHSVWMANCILEGQPKMLDHGRDLLLIYQSLCSFWFWQQEGSWKQSKPGLQPKLFYLWPAGAVK